MKRITTLLLALFALPASVWAEQGDLPFRTKGFYIGAGLGISQVEMYAGPVIVDSGDTTTTIFVGYRLPYAPRGINIALEGAYVDLGTAQDTALDSTINLEIDGFDLSALAYFPITRRWDMFAKSGAVIWDAQLNGSAPVGPAFSDSDKGTDLGLGFGAAFNTATALGLRLEIERLNVLDGAWVGLVSGFYQFK